MPLHTVEYDTKIRPYCGPTAVASITGQPISAVIREFKIVKGPQADGKSWPIRGTYKTECLRVLRRFGYKVVKTEEFSKGNRPTLNQWFKDKSGTWLVCAGCHWIAASDRKVCDTLSKQPVFMKDGPNKKRKVEFALRLTQEVKVRKEHAQKTPAQKKKIKKPLDADKKLFYKLANENKIKVELYKEQGSYDIELTCPEGKAFIKIGECCDEEMFYMSSPIHWPEALSRLQDLLPLGDFVEY